jgi:cytoskeletal protein CcmA (bactofilin family)
VPGHSQRSIGKVSVECPHCGFQQLESVFAKSTYCRKCSEHIDMAKHPHLGGEKDDSIFGRFSRLLQRETIRSIHCFECNALQKVSSFAKSSICPQCSSYIDLRDFKVSGPFGRSIHTQGSIVISARGDLTSAKAICGAAIIHGKIHGNLTCSGTARIKVKGRLMGAIEAHELVIEKGSNVEFVRPIKAATTEINGKVSARVLADAVKIGKTGSLEGTVYAKSITVDKGGIFHGELFIGKHQLTQTELLPSKDDTGDLLDLGGQDALAAV